MSRTADLLRGAAAGAAGTAALDAATYLDMALRGRPASRTPEDSVRKISEMLHIPIPGEGEKRSNRLSGLGPLMGIAAGVAAGTALGAIRSTGWRPPAPVTSAVAFGIAMLVGNGPMTVLRISNPASWSPSDWLSDVLPHMAYGAVAGATLCGLEGPGRGDRTG